MRCIPTVSCTVIVSDSVETEDRCPVTLDDQMVMVPIIRIGLTSTCGPVEDDSFWMGVNELVDWENA
jgi:hypothetical protein